MHSFQLILTTALEGKQVFLSLFLINEGTEGPGHLKDKPLKSLGRGQQGGGS